MPLRALMLSLAAAWAGPALAGDVSTMPVQVTLETSQGDIALELYPDKAPDTVANFVQYARDGHYDGTVFHRVIPGFMIQGGGYTEDFQQKPTRAPVKNEADNGLKNARGSIAMARTQDPHSASAQFFINVSDNGFLDFSAPTARGWGYAVFGKVTSGMDVVDAIVSIPTGAQGPFGSDVPREAAVIRSVSVTGADAP